MCARSRGPMSVWCPGRGRTHAARRCVPCAALTVFEERKIQSKRWREKEMNQLGVEDE